MKYFIKCLKLYADSGGRARRAEYWNFTLFNFVFAFVFAVVAEAMDMPLLSGLFSLAMFLPGFTVGMRRMHDVGKPGWFYLIPLYNLVLACTDGDNGANEYGPDPKNPAALLDEVPYSY